MSRLITLRAFLVPKLRHLLRFMTAQGITTAGNLLYGLLCVRLLPIGEYAKFAVLFGFQGSLILLMDIGISGSVIPLIGERIDDRQLIADYVASLRQLAHWLYALVVPATILLFPLLVRKQHWSWQVVSSMTAIVLASAWFARVSSAYGMVLIIRRDRNQWYRAQMISSLGTLALLGVVWALHWFNAFSTILINVSGIAFMSQYYFLRSRKLLGVQGVPSKEKRKAITHFALPYTPNVIFYGFQGQISLFLITLFGGSASVASVGALNRLSQIFSIFSQMNPILVEPYFAKLPAAKLKVNFLGTMTAVACLCLTAISLGRFAPGVFLWILGPHYANLRFETLLMVTASSIGYLTGVLWVVNTARRFVYWWNNLATIVVTIAVQVVFLMTSNLGTVRGVLTLQLYSAAAGLLVNILASIYGFVRGPRQIDRITVIPEEISPA